MRAPASARNPAVAAPRPDAEPVTIAHKPSFDIVSSFCLEFIPRLAIYHTGPPEGKLRCAEIGFPHDTPAGAHADIPACQGLGFSPSCPARTGAIRIGSALQDNQPGNAVSESENIVVETAEKIFSDL